MQLHSFYCCISYPFQKLPASKTVCVTTGNLQEEPQYHKKSTNNQIGGSNNNIMSMKMGYVEPSHPLARALRGIPSTVPGYAKVDAHHGEVNKQQALAE